MRDRSKGKILIIRGGAIGDFILTLPAVAALRRQFPEAHLAVIGYPHIVSLAVEGGLADEVRPIEARPMAGFFARGGSLDVHLADYFSEFALIVSYLYDPDGIFRENIARCSPAQFLEGPHRPGEKLGIHATEIFLKPLERLAIFHADSNPALEVEPAPELADGPWLALHPGSGSEQKNWSETGWAELVRNLAGDTARRLLIVGGEAETERVARLAAPWPGDRVRLAHQLPLPELARWLKACRGFIGHDSGISHLAAALGVPSLLLWGATSEAVWRPKGGHVALYRAGAALHDIPAATVIDEVRRRFGT